MALTEELPECLSVGLCPSEHTPLQVKVSVCYSQAGLKRVCTKSRPLRIQPFKLAGRRYSRKTRKSTGSKSCRLLINHKDKTAKSGFGCAYNGSASRCFSKRGDAEHVREFNDGSRYCRRPARSLDQHYQVR